VSTRISRAFIPYHFSFHRPAIDQTGWWRDRYNSSLISFGLGCAILMIEGR